VEKKNIAIIGGGISGLSALHFIRTRYPDTINVSLFEKDERLGGTIGTDRSDGFISDWGPNGFLDKVPLTLQMINELGLDDIIEQARPTADKRFIYRKGHLHEIEPSPIKFMKSSVLSVMGRLRLAKEPFVKPKTDDSDESIFDFAERRIGREATENMIVPMVSGIFGGDARKLSLRACFPAMAQMEKEHGSLVKAMMAKKKNGGGGPAGPGGRLTSFRNGLFTLVEKMHDIYSEYIEPGKEIIRIEKMENEEFRLTFNDNSAGKFDGVICAVPTYAASSMILHLDSELGLLLDSIPYAPIAVVSLGFRREAVSHDLNGFGFLVPRTEKIKILGSIWTSSIYPGRSPDGMVQFRTMIGSATNPELIELDNDSLVKLALDDLNGIIGINDNPQFIRVFKWNLGIPQFLLGHPEKMEKMDKIVKQYPGLQFTGNAYDGVGLNDCVTRSEKVVGRLAEQLQLKSRPEVKTE